MERADLSEDAALHQAVLGSVQSDGCAVTAGQRESAQGDFLRACLHLEKAVESGNADFAFGDAFGWPEVEQAGVLVVKPLAGGIELLERVLKMVAVMRI